MSWISDEVKVLLAWLSGVGMAVFNLLSAMGKSIAANGGPVLVQAAEDAVLAAETTGGDASAKLAAAQAAVIADLQKNGIPVVMNAVNGAIEAAVAGMKAA